MNLHFDGNSINQQRLINFIEKSYNNEEIYALGRLISIEKDDYVSNTMNKPQLCEAFIEIVSQRSYFNRLFILLLSKDYLRERLWSEFSDLNLESPLQFQIEKETISDDRFNLPMANKLFTGRNGELNDIVEGFKDSNIVIISGLGGMGKTQLAKKYIYLNLNSYNAIYWITADNVTELNSQYVRIANHLKLNMSENDLDLIIENVKTYFNKQNNNLLVFDNADGIHLNELNKYFPIFKTNIIVTTRNSAWDTENYSSIYIDDLREEDCKDFLLNNTKKRFKETTDELDSICLANELKLFPLALEHARAYINQRGISLKKYSELFNKYRFEIMNNKILDYTETVFTTWQISFSKVQEINQGSFGFLGKCSFISSDSIPIEDLFLTNERYTTINLDRIIDSLLSFSLISVDRKYVYIHSIVQEVVRNKLKESNQYNLYLEKTLNILSESFPDTTKNAEDKHKIDRLIHHLVKTLDYVDDTITHTMAFYHISRKIGNAYYEFGNYKYALIYFNKCLEFSQNADYKIGEVGALSSIGMTYLYYNRNINKALETLLFALDKSEVILESKLKSQICGNIGIVYKEIGKLDEALRYYQISLDLAEKHKYTYIQLNQYTNIGIIQKNKKNYMEAIEYYNKAILLSKEIKDEKLESKQLGNMGVVYQELYKKNKRKADFHKAIGYFSQSLEISRKLGDKRSEITSLDWIGTSYTIYGDLKEALKYLNKSLDICIDVDYKYGRTNTLLNLGVCYWEMKEIDEAKIYMKKALELSKEIGHEQAEINCLENLDKLESL